MTDKNDCMWSVPLWDMFLLHLWGAWDEPGKEVGVPGYIFLDESSFHSCDSSFARDFARSYQCKHGMSFCKDCKELYSVDQKGNCPWYAYLTPTNVDCGGCAVPDSTFANLSSTQFNHFNTRLLQKEDGWHVSTQYDQMLFVQKLLGWVSTMLVR